MPDGITDPPAYVQETREAVEARQIIEGIQQLEGALNVNALQEGIELEMLKEIPPETLGYKTFAEVLMAELGLEYRTAHRRIRASQWHTIGGIEMGELAHVAYTRLAYWRNVAEEFGWQEVLDKLQGGMSDSDMKAYYLLDSGPTEPPPPAVRHIRHACSACGHEDEIEITE